MKFLQNIWYAAAWSEALSDDLISRTIIGQPLVLFRTAGGAAAALADACPHRFAPLSRGALSGDVIECAYHGLRFNAHGTCVANPHGEINSRLTVRSYPTIERHGVVWVWMGLAEAATSEEIPDLSFMDDAPIRHTTRNYLGVELYRYDILIDNLLDLSHEDYLHRETFSGGAGDPTRLSAYEVGNQVVVERITPNMPKRPRYEYIGGPVDVKYRIRWWPSQVVAFERTYSKSGSEVGPSFTARFCHLATPETASTTHYFHAVVRSNNLEDRSVDDTITQIAKSVILGEDGPMLRAIHLYMADADLLALNPVILPTDIGAMKTRAVMRRLLEQEHATSA